MHVDIPRNDARLLKEGLAADEKARALRGRAEILRSVAVSMPPSIGDGLRRAAAELERRAAVAERKR